MRVRTAHGAWLEFKAQDPATCISERQIRRIMKSGRIPVITNGAHIVQADMDVLEDYFRNPSQYEC